MEGSEFRTKEVDAIDKTAKEIDEAQQKLDNAKQELSKAKLEREELLSVQAESKEEQAKLKAQIEKATQEKEVAEKRVSELEKALQEIKTQAQTLKNTINQMESSIDTQLNKSQSSTETSSTETQNSADQNTSEKTSTSTSAQPASQNTPPTETVKIDNKPDSTPQSVSSTEPSTENTSANAKEDTPQTPIAETATPSPTEPPNTNKTEQASTPQSIPSVKPAEQAQTTSPETKTQLSEAEQEQQISTIFESLSKLPIQNEGVFISQSHIDQLFQLEQIAKIAEQQAQAQILQQRDYTYGEMLQNPNLIEDQIKKNKEKIKENKDTRKLLKKLNKSEEKLAKSENRVNYQWQRLINTRNIRSILATWAYLDGRVSFPKEQRLVFELYKNREKLRSQPSVPISIDGQEVQIYNQDLLKHSKTAAETLAHCNQPVNALEKLLTEHTNMSLDQARSAVKIATTAGVIAGAWYGLKWLFGTTNKETKERSFNLSGKKLLTVAGVVFGWKWLTEAITGKNPLDIANHLWRTGEFPSQESTKKQSPEQQLTLGQTTAQLALLGVPYATLAQITAPKSWPISSIDLNGLEYQIQNQLKLAQESGDRAKVQQLGTQLKAIQDFKSSPNAQAIINNYLAGLNLNAQDLANPKNQGLVLDERLAVENSKLAQLNTYLSTHNLIIAPEVENIQKSLLEFKNPISESDFLTLKNKGILIPKHNEISKLQLDQRLQAEFHSAINKLWNSGEFTNIQITALDSENLKLSSDGGEILINTKTLSLKGLNNSANQALSFASAQEALHVGLLLNQIKKKFWSQTPDLIKKNDPDRPFSQPKGRENLKEWQGIIFKQAGSTQEVLNSSLPFFDQMNQFPTIEKQENRQLLINYLNDQRKKDHPSK